MTVSCFVPEVMEDIRVHFLRRFSRCCFLSSDEALWGCHERRKTLRNSQICWSAPSKCQCIDFNHTSFLDGCLCTPYPKYCSQDEGLAGALVPLKPVQVLQDTLMMREGRGKEAGGESSLLRCVPLPSRGNTRLWNQCAVKCSLAVGYSLQHYPCTIESGPCLRTAHAGWGHQHEAHPRLQCLSPPCSLPTLNALLQTVVALLTWDSSHTRVSLQQTCEHYTRTVAGPPPIHCWLTSSKGDSETK